MLLGPLKFNNTQKQVIQYLKTKVPADVFVGSKIPTNNRPDKMIIVINAGGPRLGDIRANIRINLMVWYGNTWETCQDFALLVDSYMDGLNYIEGDIIDCNTVVLPTPTGDGETVNAPVYSCSYDILTTSHNS